MGKIQLTLSYFWSYVAFLYVISAFYREIKKVFSLKIVCCSASVKDLVERLMVPRMTFQTEVLQRIGVRLLGHCGKVFSVADYDDFHLGSKDRHGFKHKVNYNIYRRAALIKRREEIAWYLIHLCSNSTKTKSM